MNKSVVSVVLGLATIALGAVSGLAQAPAAPAALPEWFPEQGVRPAAQQLAEGFAAINEDASPEDVQAAAERATRRIIAVIDGWGVPGLEERRPSFDEVEVPRIENGLGDLIGTYGVCSLGVYKELANTPREHFYVSLVEVSVGIVSAFLRHQFLEAGGTDEQLRSMLISEPWAQLSRELAQDEGKRGHVNLRCGPVFEALTQ